MAIQTELVAVGYLARGADQDWKVSLTRFVKSYEHYPAGLRHNLYVIFKGFKSGDDLDCAKSLLAPVKYFPIVVDDDSFDIGAYVDTARQIGEKTVCFLNSNSELICENWLAKLAVNLNQPEVGLVGATGSYESLADSNPAFPRFPNIHLRSNAFMIQREIFCAISGSLTINGKSDAYLFENGHESMTRRIMARGLQVLVVGRNGRGYPARWWPLSDTFRQNGQSNLLVADNQTRNFDAMPWPEKHAFVQRTWGIYLQETSVLSDSVGLIAKHAFNLNPISLLRRWKAGNRGALKRPELVYKEPLLPD